MFMGGARVALTLTSMVSSILLARLLTAKEFGFVDMAILAITMTSLFSGLGLSFAVIQSQIARGPLAFHAFVITATTGGVLMLIIEAGATPLAALLGNESAAPVFRWLAPMVLFGGLGLIPDALMQKDMLFGRVSSIAILSELSYVAVALILAYRGFGVWSLVYALCVRSSLAMTANWILCPGWDWIVPRPWDWGLVRSLLSFGLTAAGGGLITFAYSMTDGFAVSRWLGTASLGIYQRSVNLTSRSIDGINNAVSAVLLPSYAKLQDERPRLMQAYLKSLRLLAIVLVPIGMGLLVLAEDLVTTLLDTPWLPMVLPFQLFSVISTVKPLSATTSVLFTAVGQPGTNFKAGILVLTIMIPMIIVLLPFGVGGVATAVLISQMGGLVFNVVHANRVLPGVARGMVRSVRPAVMAGLAMIVAVHLAKPLIHQLTGVPEGILDLLMLMAVGVLSYSLILLLQQRTLPGELKELLLKQRS
jgi:lipopolysaccharide exporter